MGDDEGGSSRQRRLARSMEGCLHLFPLRYGCRSSSAYRLGRHFWSYPTVPLATAATIRPSPQEDTGPSCIYAHRGPSAIVSLGSHSNTPRRPIDTAETSQVHRTVGRPQEDTQGRRRLVCSLYPSSPSLPVPLGLDDSASVEPVQSIANGEVATGRAYI